MNVVHSNAFNITEIYQNTRKSRKNNVNKTKEWSQDETKIILIKIN